jgi:hypothetical protein
LLVVIGRFGKGWLYDDMVIWGYKMFTMCSRLHAYDLCRLLSSYTGCNFETMRMLLEPYKTLFIITP